MRRRRLVLTPRSSSVHNSARIARSLSILLISGSLEIVDIAVRRESAGRLGESNSSVDTKKLKVSNGRGEWELWKKIFT